MVDHEVQAFTECWISHELDGEQVSKVTLWDGPGKDRRRAVVLYGGPDDNGDPIVEITTDCLIVGAFLDGD